MSQKKSHVNNLLVFGLMPNLKMAFSVMPRRAVTAARMNTARPVKMWTGRRAFRRWDARPVNFIKSGNWQLLVWHQQANMELTRPGWWALSEKMQRALTRE